MENEHECAGFTLAIREGAPMKACAFALATFAVAWSASAEEVSLPLTDDAWVSYYNPNTNYGAGNYLTGHIPGFKDALLRFDASSIAGRPIASATLTVYLARVESSTVLSVRAITSSWRESTVTFATRPSIESEVVATLSTDPTRNESPVGFDVTSLVRRWASGELADAGLAIAAQGSIRVLLSSKEAAFRPPRLEVVIDEPEPDPRPRVLDLTSVPITIDEPGHYVLDRDWDLPGLDTGTLIAIEADNVVLDLRGFEIRWGSAGGVTGIDISGDAVVIRNGRLEGGNHGYDIRSTGSGTVVERAFVGRAGSLFDGDRVSLHDVSFGGLAATHVTGENARISRSSFSSVQGNVRIGAFAEVHETSFTGGFNAGNVVLEGGGILFKDNRFSSYPEQDALVIASNGNVVLDNQFISGATTAIRVEGTSNILRGNLALPDPTTGAFDRWGTGIYFLVSGNYYGDNQMRAANPFVLGSTTQTDWGDNVGF
jgi:hypothetical protein